MLKKFALLNINKVFRYIFTIMESPYNGSANITEAPDHVHISIPPKNHVFLMFFMSVWLLGWTVGGISVFTTLLFVNDIPFPFYIIFPVFFCFPVIFIGRILWWLFFGKEVIEVWIDILRVQKNGLLFSKPKVYDLKECKAFRTTDNSFFNSFPFGFGMLAMFKNTGNGAIAFDYGMKTIKLAESIDEAEAKYILNILKNKGVLKENNF